MPKYTSTCVMHSGINNSIESKKFEMYETYKLVLDNGEEYYIVWQHYKTRIDGGFGLMQYNHKTTNNLIGGFSKKVNPIDVYNPEVNEKIFKNLSDLIKYCNDPSNEETYGYTFELIKN